MLGGKGDEGFDAARKEYVDLIEAGIIDPTKVGPRRARERGVCRERAAAHGSHDDRSPRGEEGARKRTGFGDVGEARGRAGLTRFVSRGVARKIARSNEFAREFGPAVRRRFVDTADPSGDAAGVLPQPARDLPPSAVQRAPPHEQRQMPPQLYANGDIGCAAQRLTAVAWGKATISSSEAARTKIGASIFDKRT